MIFCKPFVESNLVMETCHNLSNVTNKTPIQSKWFLWVRLL
ncbi:hypothetical protein SAMN05216279_103113 [Pseudomonas oryzihabitans]|uniref:Uncharacterized protein n=1 Tax=Pseudomonas oryzihabitans TaxID=47885 RepID=A0A1G5MVW5_9PSED|nr:hypothetical protein SAMN05216279_103113 [Pseudomonas psychrotolerans]